MNKAFDLNEVYQDSRNEEILDGIKEQKD